MGHVERQAAGGAWWKAVWPQARAGRMEALALDSVAATDNGRLAAGRAAAIGLRDGR